MSWKTKAAVQKLISLMPETIGYKTYYWIQRNFGALKSGVNVEFELRKSNLIVEEIAKQNLSIVDKEIIEIGAGRTLNTEIGLWLCGCRKIIAVDLNPYLAADLVSQSIEWLKTHSSIIEKVLGSTIVDRQLFDDRLTRLLKVESNAEAIIELINLTYLAPADARNLSLEDDSFDIHISTNVLEHVPKEDIRQIMLEAKRVLKPNGLLVHRIDLSDHFAHSDGSLTSINFLQFSQQEWDRLSNNKFAYHNRLRASDFRKLLSECDIQIGNWDEEIDNKALELLSSDFPLHDDFQDYSKEDLATHFVTCAGKFG